MASPLSLRSALTGLAGPDRRAQLSRTLAVEFGYPHVTLTSSGTTALQLVLASAMQHRRRRRIAMPAFACYDLVTAAWACDAEVAFYDLDPTTLGPDLPSFADACAGSAAAVLAHLYGVPQPSDALRGICAREGTLLIDDLAQADGASLSGRPLGDGGEAVVLSFGRGKGWAGGGGALLTREPLPAAVELPELAAHQLRDVAVSVAQWVLGRPMLYAIPAHLPGLRLGETTLRAPGPVAAMPVHQARMVIANRASLDRERKARRRNAALLLHGLNAHPSLRGPALAPHADPGWLRLPLVSTGSGAVPIAPRLGVLRSYPRTLPSIAREAGVSVVASDRAVLGAEELAARVVTLPTHSMLSPRDLNDLVRWLRRVAIP